MAPHKICVCDCDRKKLIGTRLDLVDTVHVPFAELMKSLSNVPQSGLWLDHFRGIPKGPRLSRFDVIYLDAEARILDCVENFTVAEFEPMQEEAESALVLPAHSLASIRVRPGDQLRICRSGKVIAGEPSLPGEHCIRDLAPNEPPKEIKRPISTSVAAPETHRPPRTLRERFLLCLFPEAENMDRRSGIYLFTEERWLPGTRLVMMLQKEGTNAVGPEEITRVESEVVRWGEDGIGCRFVESGFVDLNSGEIVEGRVFDRNAFDRFLQHVTGPNQR